MVALFTVLCASVSPGGLRAAAHHGWADYDRSGTVEINGVIVASRYENPHCYARVRVKDEEWVVELAAIPRMRSRGITPEMIKPGTEISMVGHPHKTKAREMKAIRLALDGKKIELR